MLNKVTRYLIDHWQGKQGLAWSFWVNFVALRALIFFTQAKSLPEKGEDYSDHFTLIVFLVLTFHILLFLWQAVGVFRAADKYQIDTGSQAHTWGAQISLGLSVFITFSAALEAWQTTIPVSKEQSHLLRVDRENAGKYTLVVKPDEKTLTIDGTIELGITRNLGNLLKNSPKVETAILTSDGGNIYEARGLAKLFREFKINTHVTTNCTSACTSAFVGGIIRSMGPDARFGFHQYRIDSTTKIIHDNTKGEQERDQAFFRSNGVNDTFVEKMFDAPSNEMWFPSKDELLQSGYVQKITDTIN